MCEIFNVFAFLGKKNLEDINRGKRSPQADSSFVELEIYTYGNPSFKNTRRFYFSNFTKKKKRKGRKKERKHML